MNIEELEKEFRLEQQHTLVIRNLQLSGIEELGKRIKSGGINYIAIGKFDARIEELEKHWTRQQEDIDNIHKNIDVLYKNYRETDKHITDLKEKYCKTYQTIYHGVGESRIERLKEDLDNLYKKFNSLKDDCDEMFNRVEHHSSFYDRFIRAEKKIKRLENPEVIMGFDPAGNSVVCCSKTEDGLVKYEDEFTIKEGEKEVGDIERCNHSGKKPDHKGLPHSKPSDIPYCYQDKCVDPYKIPESIKFIKEFDFNEQEREKQERKKLSSEDPIKKSCFNCLYQEVNHNCEPCGKCFIHNKWKPKKENKCLNGCSLAQMNLTEINKLRKNLLKFMEIFTKRITEYDLFKKTKKLVRELKR